MMALVMIGSLVFLDWWYDRKVKEWHVRVGEKTGNRTGQTSQSKYKTEACWTQVFKK